jgi:hypothetical protein
MKLKGGKTGRKGQQVSRQILPALAMTFLSWEEIHIMAKEWEM